MAEHIQVQDIVPRIQYTADGINKTFETPFIIFNEDALDVYLNEEKVTEGYTIQLDDEMRGKIIFDEAPSSGTLITLTRHLTIARTSDFQEGGSLRANTLNYELDYQTACLQELADNINRSMVLPPYAVGSDTQLTLPTPNPGKSIVWSQDGTYLENSTVNINAVSAELDAKVNASSQNAASSQLSSQLAQNMAVLAQTKAELAEEQASIATQKAQEATTVLAGKANKDMDNLTTAGKENIFEQAVLVEKYCEGTEWYRIWSDGWIEQGGRAAMLSTSTIVNLLKPFSDQCFCVTTATWQHYTMRITILSPSQVDFDYPNTGTGHFCWYACGY